MNNPANANCIYSTDPDWSWESGASECRYVNGEAHKFILEEDINPHSSSYADTRWQDVGPTTPTGDCISNTIYARLTYENIWSDYNATYGDVVVRFYSDPACTMPVSVYGLTTVYDVTNNCYGDYTDVMSADGYEVYLGYSVQLYFIGTVCNFSWCSYRECYTNYALKSGYGYTPM